jgi:very-short-patch-repair endonuclease
VDVVGTSRPGQGDSMRRVELVQKSVRDWTAALVDLGGRNNLLHYRDLRQGTLDITLANHQALMSLLQGRSVKVSALFGNSEHRDQALRRIRVIYNKAKENFEERGLETLSLACGLATWENKRAAWEPSAPVLLRPASLRPLGAARDDFEICLQEEMVVNETLLQVLSVAFDCEFDQAMLLERIDGVIDEPWELEESFQWLKEQAGRVPGFRIEPRMILANFAYAKLAMVRDLEQSFDQLAAHPLIGALAGDEECRESLRAEGPGPDAVPHPDHLPLADEFLVLDADSSQNYAINSVLAGRSLIVKGPPGTGKSQTIANLISSLIARQKKVLFVAEKRAAIDAVTKRLKQQGMQDLVLDLHGGVVSRQAFARSIERALTASRSAPVLDVQTELRDLEKRRDELNSYENALHEVRQPWGLSIYEVRAELMGLESATTTCRLRGRDIDEFGRQDAHQAGEHLAEFTQLGSLSMVAEDRPWCHSPVASGEEVQAARKLVDDVRRLSLPRALELLQRANTESGLESPESLAAWVSRLELWTNIAAALAVFKPTIFETDLSPICQALVPATKGHFSRLKASLASATYREARQKLRSSQLPGRKFVLPELYAAVNAARVSQLGMAALATSTAPVAPAGLTECRSSLEQLVQELEQLQKSAGRGELLTMPLGDLTSVLDDLIADRATLFRLPKIHQLEAALVEEGLKEFLDEMKSRRASEEVATKSWRYMWLSSILDRVDLSDTVLGTFVGNKHDGVVTHFRQGDQRHIEQTSTRIRRIWAESSVRTREEFKDQAALVTRQIGLKRRHMPVRDFVRNAADVLLALKPCWAMSPLMVSQLLPAKKYFDVVVFDEASQVTPADAVASIMRGRLAVVAGDDKQLPPTAFFLSGDSEEEDLATGQQDLDEVLAGTAGFESILDALGPLLRFRMLQWHYRSRDERLIAFSNAHLYDRMLTTFAGVGGGEILRRVHVAWDSSADTNSPIAEVDTVVDLVLQHAREHPEESLGVISMGIRHANRIEERLHQRLAGDGETAAELRDFFDESREEHFFVKNLERVQGDERDAIILSIGYGKGSRGELPYRFGPLLLEGGERRLNVAVTRAKNRITLVSSFSHLDMDPERSSAEGVKLLRQYFEYVESGGTNLGSQIFEKPALNPFEVDVRDSLARLGIRLTPQYGTSGYWIDFAVQHPIRNGRYILAVECDGATYHSSQSARDRDRLRQEHLERLGWRFHRIWSSEWFHDKAVAVAKVLAAYDRAVLTADSEDAAGPLEQLPAPEHAFHVASQLNGARRLEPKPLIIPGRPIAEYWDADLLGIIRWVESDNVLRTEDELFEEMVRVLGYKRRGRIVVARLTAAIRQSRKMSR